MVERITLFEPHVEGIQIGSGSGESGAGEQVTGEVKETVDTIRSRLEATEDDGEEQRESSRIPFLTSAGAFVIGVVAVWWFLSRQTGE